ncbi:putative aldehyde dehydrogenase [Melioribacter roseus P3M-2]|uniref:Putative aldehyde dehydrogenase n=1 Tax=Melioribacter roseus (strain DSM 23840 / JCM 17771 / VKM B-2668 / P3M-2) TaxID=1191523 RepID=I7A236_MELRP|nr:NAD-dependent succinate-semialdehyde dehydrogenase [Melioribacter roseus]AFN73976.1 putative aldehyde dehydrogenase [Melioribacter roseus P3M-2]
MPLKSVNPATGKLIKEFSEMSKNEVEEIISSADAAFRRWKEYDPEHRCELMKKAGNQLLKEKERYAETITNEMGKPIAQSVAEVEKCAWVCDYYAENAANFLADEIIETDATESYVSFEPLGVILAVMPWNFPFWQVFRFAAPALTAGNGAVLKHASNVSMCALAIEEVFAKAGFPENLFRTLLVASSSVKNIIDNDLIKAATLTGSEFAGSMVASECGGKLKKTVLELGGSDPFIVLNDAELVEAASVGVKARIINNGQSCIAAKRFIVAEEIYDEFMELFIKNMKGLKVGNPMEKDCDLGPIAREDLLAELEMQVKKSTEMGAAILTGGKRLNREGFFMEPTILEGVKKGMPAYEEEIFGPVASVIKIRNVEEAIKIANDTSFGLGASIWTKDIEKAKLLARKIDSGSVFINGMVKSDPRLPFGGIKKSGYGRELSHYGMKEFVNIKTVWIK